LKFSVSPFGFWPWYFSYR